MKTRYIILALLLAVFAGGTAMGQQAPAQRPPAEITGTWHGRLQVDPSTQLAIQFTFAKRPDGTYSAVLNSLDNGAIKNVAASSVTLKDGAVTVQVPSLSGTYAGMLKGASIDGKWTQNGTAMPLMLTQHQKPQLSKAAIDTLVGTWNGPMAFPGGKLTLVARFKLDDKGALQGSLAVPEQGGTEARMSDIEFAENKLSFSVPARGAQFAASYGNNQFVGTWKQGPASGSQSQPVTLKKGEYVASVQALELSKDVFEKLAGNWEGTLKVKTPQGNEVSYRIVMRFLSNKSSQYVGFVDSPDTKGFDIPITDVTLLAGKLVVKIVSIGAEYKADLSDETMVGQMAQGRMTNPLTLTKK